MRRSAPTFAALAPFVALVALVAGCGAPTPRAELAVPSSRERAPAAPAFFGPARYVFASLRDVIEQRPDGAAWLVLGGARVAVTKGEVTEASVGEGRLRGGAQMPEWLVSAAENRVRYVFWDDQQIVGAQTFFGELTPLGRLPDAPYASFPWTDGVGLVTPTGLFVVAPDGSAPRRFPVPLAVGAGASGPRLGALLTRFGHAALTVDGQTFRDVSEQVGAASRVAVRGASLAFVLPDGTARLARADGRFEPRDVFDAAVPAELSPSPFEAVTAGGIALGEGRVLVASGRHYGVLEPASGAFTPLGVAPLEDASCAPFRAPDATLLLCASTLAAIVLDLSATPRVERTFDLVGAPRLHRFVGMDGEGLGFLGSCAAPPEGLPLDGIASASVVASSLGRSPVLCMRRPGGLWSEHHVEPADAPFVHAWAPSFFGPAVALIALPRPFLDDRARVSAGPETRIVRFAREEPPLVLPRYATYAELSVLNRDFVAAPEGTVFGWMITSSAIGGPTAVRFGEDGRLTILAGPSRALGALPAGRFALYATEDGRLFETVDHGQSQREVAPPPGGALARPEVCSPAGCGVRGVLRLGWDGDAKGALPVRPGEAARARAAAASERLTFFSLRAPEPVLELGCQFTSPRVGASTPGSWSFGAGAMISPQELIPSRLGAVGSMLLPGGFGGPILLGRDAELGWIAPFDTSAQIRRKSQPLEGLVAANASRPYEAPLGSVLRQDGSVGLVPLGPEEWCLGELFAAAGLTAMAECLDGLTLGVELGDSALFVGDLDGSLRVATLARSEGRAPRGLRPLAEHPLLAPHRPRETGLGRLGAGALLVAVEGDGRAVGLPIDSATGALGSPRPLASLAEASLGWEPRCAGDSPGEATVLLPFDREIGLIPGSLPGVGPTDMPGLARLRWSASRVCLDALELAVRDERDDPDMSTSDGPGVLRKLIVTADTKSKALRGTLVLVAMGLESRQAVRCERARPH